MPLGECLQPPRRTIVAVKGLGGHHLACDATHEEAVERRRARKLREKKPLAVMTSEPRALGEIRAESAGLVLLDTSLGGTRIVDTRVGDPLPRIC